jgi:hypothetical protein
MITVAFQGTNDAGDWHNNFDFSLVPFFFGRVSRGFLTSFSAVKLDLSLAAMPDGDEPVLVTGHSRGGPHAVLFALYLAELGIRPTCLYTFASPKWCDSAYAKYVDRVLAGMHHRFVYESDLVARLPFTFLGHAHCGELQWFDGRRWRPDMPLLTRLGVYLLNRRWPLIGNNVADHGIAEYIHALTPPESRA